MGKVAYLLPCMKGGKLVGPTDTIPLIVGSRLSGCCGFWARFSLEDLGLDFGEFGALPTEEFMAYPAGSETFRCKLLVLLVVVCGGNWSSSIRLDRDSKGPIGLSAKTGVVQKCSTGILI